MSTTIICPTCKTSFNLEEVLTEDIVKSIKNKYDKEFQVNVQELKNKALDLEKQRTDFEEKKKNENELFTGRVKKEVEKLGLQQEERIRKSVSNDYENQFLFLKQTNQEQDEKLKAAQKKELEFLQKEKRLKEKEEEMEIQIQRKVLSEREKMKEQLSKEEAEKSAIKDQAHQMEKRELEKKLDDQRKLAEEMKRKAEQGSMQLQGEVQELALEETLRTAFPFDLITEVGKGVRGADCIQTVRNNFGQECGKIIYESKRTKDFSKDWIEKLKADMRIRNADLAVIVTQVMPKDMERFGQRDGVWVCTFPEVNSLAYVLRDGVLKMYNQAKSQENRGSKTQLLYSYLTSREFAEQWKAIREGFTSMMASIQNERNAMEKLWKARENQLKKILLNTAHIKGSIEGISGMEAVDLNLLPPDEPTFLA